LPEIDCHNLSAQPRQPQPVDQHDVIHRVVNSAEKQALLALQQGAVNAPQCREQTIIRPLLIIR